MRSASAVHLSTSTSSSSQVSLPCFRGMLSVVVIQPSAAGSTFQEPMSIFCGIPNALFPSEAVGTSFFPTSP
ncbi:unnamed protein product, partial [Citrullus colocynthis]